MSGKIQVTMTEGGISLHSPAMAEGEVELTHEQVDNLIAVLSEYRRRQGGGSDFKPGTKVEGVAPLEGWYVQHDALGTAVMMHIPDQRFGWLHYMMDKETAKSISHQLSASADVDPLSGKRGS